MVLYWAGATVGLGQLLELQSCHKERLKVRAIDRVALVGSAVRVLPLVKTRSRAIFEIAPRLDIDRKKTAGRANSKPNVKLAAIVKTGKNNLFFDPAMQSKN